MKPVDFRRQIFRDSTHWDYGLSFKLERSKSGGVALFSRPTFEALALQAKEASGVASFALDECGCIFWIFNCQLYRFDPISSLVESLIPLAECSETFEHWFGRMLWAKRRLWILDRGEERLIALRTDTFQIITEITLNEPIDMARSKDRLYVIDRSGISVYDVNGKRLGHPRREHLTYPVAIAVTPNGEWIYVIDNAVNRFLRFKPDGSFQDELGNFGEVAPDFKPHLMAINSRGNIFVSNGSKILHEFSPDGGYIGSTGDLSPLSGVFVITAVPGGDLCVSSPEGIARFSFKTGISGNQGVFYCGTLDSGCDGNDCWHRIDVIAELEAGGVVDVYYATSDEAALASAVNNVIKQETPLNERAEVLDNLLSWNPADVLSEFAADDVRSVAKPGTFRKPFTHSILLRNQTSRYLWIKLALSGLTPGARAAVRELRIYYPRLSYLRYLPAVYQEDPLSREFLERYLSLFETVFADLEATIDRIPELFDPELTPKEFLDWLAQWLDLGIEEDWPVEVKRRLISRAGSLYQKKGTPEALIEFIEIVTQKRPFIRESFMTQRPFILGDDAHLGLDTPVFQQPTTDLSRNQRTILGAAPLGASQLRDTTKVAVNPFRAAANHFSLLLDLSEQEFQRYERGLHRIIRDNTPAHVGYDIRLVSAVGLGPDMVLGVNFKVEDPRPLYLGSSSLGRSILSGFSYGPELGIDTTLAGCGCPAFCYGEQ